MTTLLTLKARATAFACPRGDYQQGLLIGLNSWSGNDLKGTAGKYGGKYRDSRDALLARLAEAGLYVERTTGARGRIVVVIMTMAERRRGKDCPAAEVAAAIIEKGDKAEAAAKVRAARAKARAERELSADLPTLEMLAHAR